MSSLVVRTVKLQAAEELGLLLRDHGEASVDLLELLSYIWHKATAMLASARTLARHLQLVIYRCQMDIGLLIAYHQLDLVKPISLKDRREVGIGTSCTFCFRMSTLILIFLISINIDNIPSKFAMMLWSSLDLE